MSGTDFNNDDPIEKVLSEIGQTAPVDTDVTTLPVDTDVTTLPVDTDTTTLPVDTDVTTLPVDTDVTTLPVEIDTTTLPAENVFDSLDDEQLLKAFNKVTGLNVETIESIKEYSSVFEKLPENKKNLELFPKLVEKLKESANVLSHFQDSTAYKVAQLSKGDEDYRGKEGIINEILRSDFKSISDLDALKLSASLAAPGSVRNPLRAKIQSMGLDPDDVIGNYDGLSEDDKDTIAMAAASVKKELRQLGEGIEIPEAPADILKDIEAEMTVSKEDLENKMKALSPIATSMVGELKELKVGDDFVFQLELTNEEKTEFSELIVETLASGEFDISTEQGKKELWSTVEDAAWLSKKEVMLEAYANDIREKADEAARLKYENQKPIDRDNPLQKIKDADSNPIVDLVEGMINEMK